MDSGHSKFMSRFQRPFFSFNSSLRSRKEESPQTPSIVVMNEDEVPKCEDVSAPQEDWSTPTTQAHLTPTTMGTMGGGYAYCLPVDQTSQPPMLDAYSTSMQRSVSEVLPRPASTQQDFKTRPVSSHQEFHNPVTVEDNFWPQKPYESQYHFQGLVPDVPIGQAFTSDEAIPIMDLEHQAGYQGGYINFDAMAQNRRISGSSFSVSTSGALSDIPSYDDFSTALSDAPDFGSEYPAPSNRNSWMGSTNTQLSPVASPCRASSCRPDFVRAQSRGRSSQSPRPSARSAPYTLDVPKNGQRWSTGNYGPMPARRPSPLMYQRGPEASSMAPMGQLPTSQPPYMMPCPMPIQKNSMLLPAQMPSQLPSQYSSHLPSLPSQTLESHSRFYDAPQPLMSHGLLRMLQSNADVHSLHRRYAELSDPPDLFGGLNEEQCPPPEEDMHPEDPDMTPHEQELRFEGDLYTPKWVRGHGNKREGWCGICKPGRWLVLKNSAYWYDKSFSHGISAATGTPFQEPLDTRRMDGNPDVWEGLCGSCNEWITLVSSKKKGTTWFRHAYKCHSHPKAKDSAKRRRENSHSRCQDQGRPSKMLKLDTSVGSRPATPYLTPPSGANTPEPMSAVSMPQLPSRQDNSLALGPTLMSNGNYLNMA